MKKRSSDLSEPQISFAAFTTDLTSSFASHTSVAWHEAGHTVAILKLGLPLFSARIYEAGIVRGEVAYGVCENKISETILSLHCGLAAERLIFRNAPNSHGEADLVAARNLMSSIGFFGGPAPLRCAVDWQAKPILNQAILSRFEATLKIKRSIPLELAYLPAMANWNTRTRFFSFKLFWEVSHRLRKHFSLSRGSEFRPASLWIQIMT